MKKIIIYVLFVFCLDSVIYSQNNILLTKQKVEKISTLSNVWGLLKYYHPRLKKNKISFDEWNIVLNKNIDIILGDKIDFNNQIKNLINDCGYYKIKSKTPPSKYINNDIFKWIKDDSLLSTKNKNALKQLILNSYNIKHKQITKEILKNYNIKKHITKEFYLDSLSYNRIALIGLISYIQDVKYFYANKKFLLKDINSLQKEFIPKAYLANSFNDYLRVILRLAANINDSHSRTYSPIKGKRLRVYTKIINDTVVILKNKTNLPEIKEGDYIVKINDIPVKTYIDSLKLFVSASSKQAKNKKVNNLLLYSEKENNLILDIVNSKGNRYNITANPYKNNNPYTDHKIIARKMSEYKKDSAFKVLQDNIGYINIGYLRNKDISKAFRLLKNTKGIIIDCRIYNTINVNKLLKYFSNKHGKYINIELYSKRNIGFFEKNIIIKSIVEKVRPFFHKSKNKFYEKYYKNKKIVILINENNISFSEQLLLAIKYSRQDAVFIGRPTDGTFGNNTYIKLPKNLFMSFTTAKVKNLNNQNLHGIGIKPDIFVKQYAKNFLKNNRLLI